MRLCQGCFEDDRMIGEWLCKDCLLDIWASQKSFIDENEVRDEWKVK